MKVVTAIVQTIYEYEQETTFYSQKQRDDNNIST